MATPFSNPNSADHGHALFQAAAKAPPAKPGVKPPAPTGYNTPQNMPTPDSGPGGQGRGQGNLAAGRKPVPKPTKASVQAKLKKTEKSLIALRGDLRTGGHPSARGQRSSQSQ